MEERSRNMYLTLKIVAIIILGAVKASSDREYRTLCCAVYESLIVRLVALFGRNARTVKQWNLTFP
jgi:hypothetical protein